MPRTFSDAPAQVRKMVEVWLGRGGDVDEMVLDAFAALGERTDVQLLAVPEHIPTDANLDCSVSGGYRWQTSPPTLVVAEAMSRRRQQFTLLHELGHHLQKTDPKLGETVLEHDDPEAFEDACCDAFAATVLLPDDLVRANLTDRGPTITGAVELFRASNASRAAICVRLAPFLAGAGAVVVLDESGTVTFAASHGGMYPPARGSSQVDNPLVAAALAENALDRVLQRNDARIWYRDGHSSTELYGQAAWIDGRLMMIVAEYGAAWLSYSPPKETPALYLNSKWEECETCGKSFEIRVRCFKCGQAKCPSGHCGCTVASDKTCERCFMVKHSSQFPSGSKICTECLE